MAKKFFSLDPNTYFLHRQTRKGHKNEVVLSLLACAAYTLLVYRPQRAALEAPRVELPSQYRPSFSVEL